jgi:S1-C subfamily serine protease
MANSLGLTGGALVNEVTKDSPADLAGLKPQDIITTVNGKHVSGIADVIVNVRTRKVGDVVKVTVWRAGHPQSFSVTLRERGA